MTVTSKKRAYIASRFTDHGTGEKFEVGDTPMLDAGTYANYEAAGLIGTPPPAAAKASPAKPSAKPKAAKKASKPKAKPAATASASASTAKASSMGGLTLTPPAVPDTGAATQPADVAN